MERTRQRDNAFEVFNLLALDFAILGVGVDVGKILANGGDAGTSVRVFDNFIWIETVLDRPSSPDARDGGSGVEENSIHVEEKRGAGKLGHG